MYDTSATSPDYARLMFGQHAAHVPAWMFVQNHGDGVVSFIGSSSIPALGDRHPLRYGSARTHQLIVGEMLIRPHWVLGADALKGAGLGHLAIAAEAHRLPEYLAEGEVILDPSGRFPLNNH